MCIFFCSFSLTFCLCSISVDSLREFLYEDKDFDEQMTWS